MRRAVEHRPAGSWPAEEAVDRVRLDFEDRGRRRIRFATETGAEILLDLKRPHPMAGGDGLRCDDGSWIAVEDKPEPLSAIIPPDRMALVRIAWHLGNRHAPAELADGRILIRPDHVLEDMARGFGCRVEKVVEPFRAEGGAYAAHGH